MYVSEPYHLKDIVLVEPISLSPLVGRQGDLQHTKLGLKPLEYETL